MKKSLYDFDEVDATVKVRINPYCYVQINPADEERTRLLQPIFTQLMGKDNRPHNGWDYSSAEAWVPPVVANRLVGGNYKYSNEQTPNAASKIAKQQMMAPMARILATRTKEDAANGVDPEIADKPKRQRRALEPAPALVSDE